MPWLIDAEPYQKNGWVLEHHGTSNVSLGRKSLADVPTVDAEPVRHGHWIFVSETKYEFDTEIEDKCSACGRHVTRYDMSPPDKYCPTCGRKMDEKEGAEK